MTNSINSIDSLKNYVRPYFKTGPKVSDYLKRFAASQKKRKAGIRTRSISDCGVFEEIKKLNPGISNQDALMFQSSLEADYR